MVCRILEVFCKWSGNILVKNFRLKLYCLKFCFIGIDIEEIRDKKLY